MPAVSGQKRLPASSSDTLLVSTEFGGIYRTWDGAGGLQNPRGPVCVRDPEHVSAFTAESFPSRPVAALAAACSHSST